MIVYSLYFRFGTSVYQSSGEYPWSGYKETDRGVVIDLTVRLRKKLKSWTEIAMLKITSKNSFLRLRFKIARDRIDLYYRQCIVVMLT